MSLIHHKSNQATFLYNLSLKFYLKLCSYVEVLRDFNTCILMKF